MSEIREDNFRIEATPIQDDRSKHDHQVSLISESVQSLLEKMPSIEEQKQAPSMEIYFVSHVRRPNSDLPARLYSYQAEVDSKLKKLAEEQESRMMEECTFHPLTNQPGMSRSFAAFLSEQSEFEFHRQEKLQELREEKAKQSVDSSFFKPSLCERSLKLISHRDLSTISKKQPCTDQSNLEDSNCTFAPTVSTRPRKKQREVSISDHLYNDALRRIQQSLVSESFNTSKMVNPESEKFVLAKLTSEIDAAFTALCENEYLSYSMFIVLLQQLHFINNHPAQGNFTKERFLVVQAWNALQERDAVSRSQILNFLMGVMNYSSRDRHLHKTYSLFFHNKITSKDLLQTGRNEEPAFKPTISEESARLAALKHEKREDEFLVKERIRFQEKWKKMRMDKEKEETLELTFKPAINKRKNKIKRRATIKENWVGLRNENRRMTQTALNLYSLSMIRQEQAKQAAEDAAQKEEIDMAKEQFTPQIREHRLLGKKPIGEHKGVSDMVSRLRRAWKEKEKALGKKRKKHIPSFRCDLDNKGRMSQTLRPCSLVSPRTSRRQTSNPTSDQMSFSRFKAKDNSSATPEYSDESCSDDQPIEIAVKMPNGEIEKMVIYSEEEKHFILDQFILKHNLTGEIARQLREEVIAS